MGTYADLRVKQGAETTRPTVTITAAGIAAILAALPGLITLFRGEPQAQETFQYLKQSSQTLIDNQHKQHDRLVRLETMMDAYSIYQRERKEDITQKLMLLMTGAIASRRSPTSASPPPVVAPAPTAAGRKPACPKKFVEVNNRCMTPAAALQLKEEELARAQALQKRDKERFQTQLKAAKKQRDTAQRPSSPQLPFQLRQ